MVTVVVVVGSLDVGASMLKFGLPLHVLDLAVRFGISGVVDVGGRLAVSGVHGMQEQGYLPGLRHGTNKNEGQPPCCISKKVQT